MKYLFKNYISFTLGLGHLFGKLKMARADLLTHITAVFI